jgi:hypothetical protein
MASITPWTFRETVKCEEQGTKKITVVSHPQLVGKLAPFIHRHLKIWMEQLLKTGILTYPIQHGARGNQGVVHARFQSPVLKTIELRRSSNIDPGWVIQLLKLFLHFTQTRSGCIRTLSYASTLFLRTGLSSWQKHKSQIQICFSCPSGETQFSRYLL